MLLQAEQKKVVADGVFPEYYLSKGNDCAYRMHTYHILFQGVAQETVSLIADFVQF
jgi:hypothetical protein